MLDMVFIRRLLSLLNTVVVWVYPEFLACLFQHFRHVFAWSDLDSMLPERRIDNLNVSSHGEAVSGYAVDAE